MSGNDTPLAKARKFFRLDIDEGQMSLKILQNLLDVKLKTPNASGAFFDKTKRHQGVKEMCMRNRDNVKAETEDNRGEIEGGKNEKEEPSVSK